MEERTFPFATPAKQKGRGGELQILKEGTKKISATDGNRGRGKPKEKGSNPEEREGHLNILRRQWRKKREEDALL